ncbi:MAG: glycosyltransferase family 2 protein [Desulfurococcales archaeon]|nr:glycosyltransferase family 2 protein [Desulfurococcales archaeon]
MGGPLVSVVIATRNSARTLPYALASLRWQTFRDFEVIVVDNYSVDGTRDIARRYGARVYVCGDERSRQRNYGASMARGEYLYFMDSDFILHRQVLEESVSLASKGADAVIIKNISYPGISRVARARFYERLSYIGSGAYEVARFIRRDIFYRVDGYDESLYANEDYDLYLRLIRAGARIGWTKISYELHIGEPSDLKEFIIKNYYYGYSLKKYFKKTGNALHALPLRHTYLRKDIVSTLARRWPLGLIYIPLLRITQGLSVLVGMINKSHKQNDVRMKPCKNRPL